MRLTQRQYHALAEFRYELRRFLRHSEQLTRRHGLTPLQYLLLLQIRGYPQREGPTIGELAELLQAKHHGVVALATRCEKAGLIKRRASTKDRRNVHLALSSKGRRKLEDLARRHHNELRALGRRFPAGSLLP